MEAMKAWGLDPDRWEALSFGAKALIRAHEKNLQGVCRSCGIPMDTSKLKSIAVVRRECGGCKAVHADMERKKPKPHEHLSAIPIPKDPDDE